MSTCVALDYCFTLRSHSLYFADFRRRVKSVAMSNTLELVFCRTIQDAYAKLPLIMLRASSSFAHSRSLHSTQNPFRRGDGIRYRLLLNAGLIHACKSACLKCSHAPIAPVQHANQHRFLLNESQNCA